MTIEHRGRPRALGENQETEALDRFEGRREDTYADLAAYFGVSVTTVKRTLARARLARKLREAQSKFDARVDEINRDPEAK